MIGQMFDPRLDGQSDQVHHQQSQSDEYRRILP